MTNDEIKELLRDLAQKAEEEGEVKSKKIRISFTPDEPETKTQENNESGQVREDEQETSGGRHLFASLKERFARSGRGRKEEEDSGEASAQSDENDLPGEDSMMETVSSGGEVDLPAKEIHPAETSFPGEEKNLSGKAVSMDQVSDYNDEDTLPGGNDSPQEASSESDSADEGLSGTKTRKGFLSGLRRRKKEQPDVSDTEDDTVYRDTGEDDAADSSTEKTESAEEPAEPEKPERAQKPEKTGAVKRTARKAMPQPGPETNRRGELVEPAAFESDEDAFLDDETQREMEQAVMKRKGSIKQRTDSVLSGLRTKGIGTKELAMIAAGIVLCLLIAAVVLSVLSNRRKSANVTADEGLIVTIEKEPAKWCTHGDVVLGIRTNSPIQSILVNGNTVDYVGSTRTQIAVDADADTLELMVVSEAEVMNASVKLQKVDAADPAVSVSVQEGKVHLDASDEGSGVAGLWYGIKEAFLEVPMYQLYKEPFEPESGKKYAYFAVDHAGNATTPVETTLTPATALTVPVTEISLFPGETFDLQIEAEPKGGFVNGLQIISDNESIVTVEDVGTLLAVADGEANVVVSADELPSVTCHVTVRSSASVTISAVGDVTLGDDINFSPLNSFSTVQSMYGNSYFFENVRSIFSADDITFANLEGTLTDQGIRTEKQYAFRGDPSYVQILNDGSIEAVTLANNHSSDYGEVSLTDTEKYLDGAGVEWCTGDKIILKEVNGVKVALIGIYVLADGAAKASQVESTIAAAQEAGARIIVVAFHWGNERETKPDSTQQTLGRLAIDCGADLVVGHHPHVLQGIEKYSGKYICYSLGNFCFGGNSNPSDMDTMIFQQTFEIKRGGIVEAGDAAVIPCRISSIDTWNNYQPTPATGDNADRIMARINELCEPFKTSF